MNPSHHHGFSEIRHGGTVAAIEETDRLASLPQQREGNLLVENQPCLIGFLAEYQISG